MITRTLANAIDHLESGTYRSNRYAAKIFYIVAARLVSLTFCPIALLASLVHLKASLVMHGVSYLTKNQAQSKWAHEHVRLSGSLFLAGLALPVGLIQPLALVRRFVDHGVQPAVFQPYGNESFKVQRESPRNVAELKEVVRRAKSVAVVGAGFSQGLQAVPCAEDAVQICLDAWADTRVQLTDSGSAIIPAAMRWEEVQAQLASQGYALKVAQASPVFSVGGSVSVNCHGWDIRSGTLGDTINRLWIVDADGNERELVPGEELFRRVVGGYGLHGVITQVELQVARNTLLEQSATEVALEDYVAHFDSLDERCAMQLGRLSLDAAQWDRVISLEYRVLSEQPQVEQLTPEMNRGAVLDRIKLELGRCSAFFRRLGFKWERSALLAGKVTLTRNQAMRPVIKSIFNDSFTDTEWLQEYFVTREQLAPFVQRLGRVLADNRVHLLNASIRYVRWSDAEHRPLLDYAPNQDHFAIVLFFNQVKSQQAMDKTNRWVKEINDWLACNHGAAYLPYAPRIEPEHLDAMYPARHNLVYPPKFKTRFASILQA